MTRASAKRCSCRSAGCSTPTRWPSRRLLRCSAVRPATWLMWRRCGRYTRWSSFASWPPRRTLVLTAGFSPMRWPPPRLTPTSVGPASGRWLPPRMREMCEWPLRF
jgi:hypothetical protein